MSSDLARLDEGAHRYTGGERASPIAPDHKDLVAYWKFDEGRGFVVHDVTCALTFQHGSHEPCYHWSTVLRERLCLSSYV